jgi:pSer/pThr/pTyr-binding forkhead associated (FHA) protein
MKIRLSINAGSVGKTTFEHPGPVIRVGRDPECELSLQGEKASAVSRQHARIELNAAGATLTDTGSSNGTLLNGRLLEGPAPLRVGDRFQMGFTGATLTVQELDLATPSANNVLMRRAALIGIPALLALAALVIGVVVLRKPKAREDHAQAPPTQPPADIRPPVPPPNIAQAPAPEPGTHPAPPPPSPPKVAAVQEVKEVGSYVALDNWVSVLLRREGEAHPWAVLRPESRVSTAQTLVSLPGYRSLITLDSGAHLTLWGNLPEFSGSPPVLESVVMLHPAGAGTDLDFTLDRGRVVIANRKSPAAPVRVHLRFLGEVWDLELPDDSSEAALELWGLPQRPPAGKDRAALPPASACSRRAASA